MARVIADPQYLGEVWGRINSTIYYKGRNKMELAKKCSFDRKILSMHGNMSLDYFARLCKELDVSADFLLFGVEKEEPEAVACSPERQYKEISALKETMREKRKAAGQGTCKKKRKQAVYQKEARAIPPNIGRIAKNNICGISTQKELVTLAGDFALLHRKDVREILETCKSYEDGQRKIMDVYEKVYQ